jgi:hypothetical protein
MTAKLMHTSAVLETDLSMPPGSSDAQRVAAEQAVWAESRRRAIRVVAATAHSANEARMLLDMLGMSEADIRSARTPTPSQAA